MTYDALLAVAPHAPNDLLRRMATMLAQQPSPELLLSMGEAIHQAAEHYTDLSVRTVREMEQLAAIITADVTVHRQVVRKRPVSVVDDLRGALWEVVQAVPGKDLLAYTDEGAAWRRALTVIGRANRELGPPRSW